MPAASATTSEFVTPRPIAGYRVVATAFLLAVFAWGHGFYGLSVYVQFLGGPGGWSPTLLSAATTFYFVLGALAMLATERLSARVPWRRLSAAGVVLMSIATSALAWAPNVVLLVIAYAAMACAWAACSGTAVNGIVGQWFDERRGMAASIALTGASFGGIVVVPLFVFAIGRLGVGTGIATVSMLLALAMLVLIRLNLVAPTAVGHERGSSKAMASAAAVDDAPLARANEAAPIADGPPLRQLAPVCALFAIGWYAQAGFLALQIPILAPRIGEIDAAAAVAATPGAAIAGRLLLGLLIDRLDHRLATAASYLLQVAGMGVLLVADTKLGVFAGCMLFGLSVGNIITLPTLFAQREFAARHYGRVIARIWSTGQLVFAFGPVSAGLVLAAADSSGPAIAGCAACQLVAALLSLYRGRGPVDAGR